MKLPDLPFSPVFWDGLPAVEHPGAEGTSFWRTFERNGLRLRMVSYLAGFRSDHWCARGHVLFVLRGAVTLRLKDGRTHELGAGTSFAVGDDEANPHEVASARGADVFIAD
jgi:quercetin dioxygenase-like cupin family protein